MQSWIPIRGWVFILIFAGLGLSGCGSISTYQTGKTVPRGKLSFGMGMGAGLYRTKSPQAKSPVPEYIRFPVEFPSAAAEVFAGYGLFDFLELNAKVMVFQYTAHEDFKQLSGIPLFGGGSTRLALAQERWGFPFSIALGTGYYAGSIQDRGTTVDNIETHRRLTTTKDHIYFVNVSKDLIRWLTLYGAWKIYYRATLNKEWDHGKLIFDETIDDEMRGYGAGISFNVGRDRNTHIMLEINDIRDKDEPARHYQKQAGLGMSVEF